ncbi:MAG: TIGR00341 family protein [Ignavibacteria bacterium]
MIPLLQWFHKLGDIRSDSCFESTYQQTQKDIRIRGASLVYLICSAVIASIGLDVGSPAVIIGAMLISPFMSPILGIGLSLGIHDRNVFLISIREFIFSIFISLLISIVYFSLTPLGTPNPELLARIKPTVLDILIAFFGGTAGIVALTRKSIGNALPGVAIATALMPPICTAGFGLATERIEFFLGALYLFLINAVFISLSSYLISKYLKFPLKSYPNKKQLCLTRITIITIVTVIAIPSVKIFIDLISDLEYQNSLSKFVATEIGTLTGTEIIEWKLVSTPSGDNILNVYVTGQSITESKLDSLNNLLSQRKIKRTRLNLIQISNRSDLEYLKTDIYTSVQLLQEQQTHKLTEEKRKNDSLKVVNTILELRLLYPKIREIGIGYNFISSGEFDNFLPLLSIPFVKITWENNTNKRNNEALNREIYLWLQRKLSVDSLILLNN